jgi:TonB family protein
MLGRIALPIGAISATLLAACSTTRHLPPNPYANCVDLGTLSEPSASKADAEARMRTRVRELGGDTLIFGERGRVGRDATPEEVSRGRDARVGADTASHSEPPTAATEQTDDAIAPTAPEGSGLRRRGKITSQSVEPLVGELWYYGAALRCNPTGNGMLAEANMTLVPLVRIAPDNPSNTSAAADGEVVLEFTIAVTGTTKDIVVVTSSAPELEAPAVSALMRWRYAPLVENGVPVERHAVRTMIRFERRRHPA